MSPVAAPASVPGVVDVFEFVSANPREGATDLVVEVPHGATGGGEYYAVAERLTSPLPANLVDFFHVNTDAGAAELGMELARDLCKTGDVRRVLVLRCRIPRTFVDCNRVLGGSAESYRAGGVTPGVPPWITTPGDHVLLLDLYSAYQLVVQAALRSVCDAGGRALLLHTYAPRTVDVDVNLDIVPALHAAYADLERWPLRPEVDLIFRRPDGTRALPDATVDALRRSLAAIGLPLAEGVSYPLHPVTSAFAHVQAWPERVVCLEVRRDLLTEAFVPFQPVLIEAGRVRRIAGALADWARSGWRPLQNAG